MSKSLVKILDFSVLPAAVLVVTKLLGILLVTNIFNIAWSIRDYTGSIFAVTTVLNHDDVITVTAYSDLFMFVIIAIFFSGAVFRTIFLHSSHASEKVILSLAKRNLLNLLKDSYTVYTQASAWWIFMLLTNVIVWVNYLTGKSFLWIGISVTFTTILLTLILVVDVFREIEHIRKHPSKYQWS